MFSKENMQIVKQLGQAIVAIMIELNKVKPMVWLGLFSFTALFVVYKLGMAAL